MLPGPDLGVVGGAGVVATVPVPWNSTRGGGTVGLLLVTGFGGLKTESVNNVSSQTQPCKLQPESRLWLKFAIIQ